MFPSFNMEICETLKPRHTWGRAKQNASRGNFLRRFLRVRRNFCEKSTSRKYQTCLIFFALRGKFLNCRFCWQSLHCPHYYTVFHYGTVDRGGSPFNVFIITPSFTMALRCQSSLFFSLFHYGTAGCFPQVTVLCEQVFCNRFVFNKSTGESPSHLGD